MRILATDGVLLLAKKIMSCVILIPGILILSIDYSSHTVHVFMVVNYGAC